VRVPRRPGIEVVHTGGYLKTEIGCTIGISDGTVRNTSPKSSRLDARDRTPALMKAIAARPLWPPHAVEWPLLVFPAPAMPDLLLSPAEARVIACMVEKSITTPAYYPMTVNAIMLAANQKSSRSPVMTLNEGDVGNALNRLEELKLVARDSFGGRVQKWRQQFLHQMLLKPHTQALLVTLMLRGPQTLAELRSNALPLGGPGDEDSVRAGLEDLADRAQALVAPLPRAPGQSAIRHGHTLCGAAAFDAAAERVAATPEQRAEGGSRTEALEARVTALEARIAQLEQALGVAGPSD
jgi:uncharacterized protein YceH (UPF0502 family)